MINWKETEIQGVLSVSPQVFEDERGFFFESYNCKVYADLGLKEFVQDNHSASKGGVLRGLHYQINHAQGKLVRVIVGDIFDVAVDLRRSSSTFGKWAGISLSAKDHRQLWLPPGVAHGFYVTSEWAEIIYKTTDYYFPDAERTMIWNDPQIGITWPLKDGNPPTLSEKDAQGVLFADAEVFE